MEEDARLVILHSSKTLWQILVFMLNIYVSMRMIMMILIIYPIWLEDNNDDILICPTKMEDIISVILIDDNAKQYFDGDIDTWKGQSMGILMCLSLHLSIRVQLALCMVIIYPVRPENNCDNDGYDDDSYNNYNG